MKIPSVSRLHQVLVTAPVQAILAVLLLCTYPITVAQEFVWAPEFPIGAAIPEISAPDQDGNVRNFDDLVGANGMLFMLNRSFDW